MLLTLKPALKRDIKWGGEAPGCEAPSHRALASARASPIDSGDCSAVRHDVILHGGGSRQKGEGKPLNSLASFYISVACPDPCFPSFQLFRAHCVVPALWRARSGLEILLPLGWMAQTTPCSGRAPPCCLGSWPSGLGCMKSLSVDRGSG